MARRKPYSRKRWRNAVAALQDPRTDVDYQFRALTELIGDQPKLIDIEGAEIVGVDAFGWLWPDDRRLHGRRGALALYTDEEDYEERVEIGVAYRNLVRLKGMTIYVFGPNGSSAVAKVTTPRGINVIWGEKTLGGYLHVGRALMPESVRGIMSMLEDLLRSGRAIPSVFKDDHVFRIYIDLGTFRGVELLSDDPEGLYLDALGYLSDQQRRRNGPTMNCNDAWAEGFNSGYGAAKDTDFEDYDWIDDDRGEVPSDQIDEFVEAFIEYANEAEQNSRQYSPWEQIADAINKSKDPDDLWECYDEGVDNGLSKGMIERFSLTKHSDPAVRNRFQDMLKAIEGHVEVTEQVITGDAPRKSTRKSKMRKLNARLPLKKGAFDFDPDMDRGYPGYDTGRNGPGGFPMPFFEEDVVRQIFDDIVSEPQDMYVGWVSFAAPDGRGKDYCLLIDPRHPEAAHAETDVQGRPVECYPAQREETEDGVKTLWPIGGGGWSWERAARAKPRRSKRKGRMRSLNAETRRLKNRLTKL